MQQQQQSANYDLMAVFPDEPRAEAATAKLQKEGFSNEEVFQLAASMISGGQFREHGPSSTRGELFLQTQRTAPNPLVVILFALIFGALAGGLTFAATFALPALNTPVFFAIGIVIGLVIGTLIALLSRRRVRGDIGQSAAQTTAVNAPPPSGQNALTVVALRLSNPDNISRKTRARAILINHQGKIDRSVGRIE